MDHDDTKPFEGTVIRRDPDGAGLVRFTTTDADGPQIGFFTHEVVYNPLVERACKVGNTVHGQVEKHGNSYQVLRIEP